METPLLDKFERYLNDRINPEKSRHFDIKRLEESQSVLENIAVRIDAHLKQDRKNKTNEFIPTQRISVVGSNGKGSTAFYLALLSHWATLSCNVSEKSQTHQSVRPTTGLFTSPHLEHVLERIRFSKAGLLQTPSPISAKEALQGLTSLKKIIPEYYEALSYFELLTVLAYYLFQKNRCAWQIYEAGLGGRWDATRMVQASAVVLTSISKEHTHILGNTYETILKEKLGILSASKTRHLFCMPQPFLNQETIEQVASAFGSQLKIHFYATPRQQNNYLDMNYRFACFVLERLRIFKTPPNHLYSTFHIPGRLENYTVENGHSSLDVIFDTAHNPDAIQRSLQDIMASASADNKGQESLVILALLQERALFSCLKIIDSIGIRRVWCLSGGQWSSPSSIAQAKETLLQKNAHTLLQVDAITEQECLLKLAHHIQNASSYHRIIFLGSHRSYVYFQELKKYRSFL